MESNYTKMVVLHNRSQSLQIDLFFQDQICQLFSRKVDCNSPHIFLKPNSDLKLVLRKIVFYRGQKKR